MQSVPPTFPASVPCAVWLAGGGGAARFLPPRSWLWVVCPLVCGPGWVGWGGGGAACVPPRLVGVARGPRGAGGRSTSVRPSASPGQAPKQVVWALLRSCRALSPYCSCLCPLADPGCGPRGLLVRRRGTASLSRSL